MQHRVMSTDDHLQEAPDTWTSRMSSKWGDLIPQVKPLDKDRDAWFVHGVPDQRQGVAIVHGAFPDRTELPSKWEEAPEITYVPEDECRKILVDNAVRVYNLDDD